jgi:hypothetical protein
MDKLSAAEALVTQRAIISYWAGGVVWSPEEALALVCSVDPHTDDAYADYEHPLETGEHMEMADIFFPMIDHFNGLGMSGVSHSPQRWIELFDSAEIAVPKVLRDAVSHRTGKTADKQCTGTEEKAKQLDWKDLARTIADEIDAADHKADAYDSLPGIAKRVAKAMRERGIDGKRGPVSDATILRDALNGGKWKRKR